MGRRCETGLISLDKPHGASEMNGVPLISGVSAKITMQSGGKAAVPSCLTATPTLSTAARLAPKISDGAVYALQYRSLLRIALYFSSGCSV